MPVFDQGGVSPVGVVEPFNQWQRQGLTDLANINPVIENQGYIKGMRGTYQDMLGKTGSIPIEQSFARGNQFYGNAADQLQQGTRGMTDEDFANGVSRYMNPYQQQVVDRSVARINQQGDMQRSNLMGTQAGRRSFGDSSSAIQLSELARNTMGQVADTSANLNYQGYTDAANQTTSQFNNERNRNMTAGAQYGALASDNMNQGYQGFNTMDNVINTGANANDAWWRNFDNNSNNAARNAGYKITAGNAIQNQNQKVLDVVQGDYGKMQNYDNSQLTDLARYLSAFTGSNSTPAQTSPLTQLGGAAVTAGGLWNSYNNQSTSGTPWLNRNEIPYQPALY